VLETRIVSVVAIKHGEEDVCAVGQLDHVVIGKHLTAVVCRCMLAFTVAILSGMIYGVLIGQFGKHLGELVVVQETQYIINFVIRNG
tara:strand:- start:510 stop:770 length:261 start_codon:yes stop_codon:yes gene_type:complete